MDFPGCAATNIHLIDGFSTIYWRIYTEESGIANHTPEAPTNGFTILKHLGHLKYLETCLRKRKCLASCPRRLGLWVFSSSPDFESLDSLYVKEGKPPSTKILVDSTTLKVSASGSITSQDLIRGLCSESESKHGFQSTNSQRSQQGQPSTRRPDGHSSSAAIYASFISAVTGAISLDLVQRYSALPLGSRTLYTAVETLGSFSPRIDNESVLSTSFLTSLNVQLNACGAITIVPQTTSQDGITRLCSPGNDIGDLLQVPPGTDLWLCPNGTIARLVTANIESPTSPSPGQPNFGNVTTKREQWKLDVLQWLTHWGLQLDSVHDEHWVEVEVWEPFFARLAGDIWRQSDDAQPAFPLKRMLWPARFCFRRCSAPRKSSWLPKSFGDPLEFAERWFSESSSTGLKREYLDTSAQQVSSVKDHDITSPKADTVETFESLSRMAQYPDLQTNTNLVYPTPPDGAAVSAMHHTNTSDVYPEDANYKMSPGAAQNMKNLMDPEFSPDVAVGTGRYDASDDDDLFGEMNERDFGAKGITDADFSFFDDPALERMDEDPERDRIPAASHDQLERGSSRQDGYEEANPIETPVQLPGAENPENWVSPAQNNSNSDDMQIDYDAEEHSPEANSQPISPPLSPVGVKKILFAHSPGKNDSSRTGSRGQQGDYHPIAFETKLGDWSQKYGTAGRFYFSPDNQHQASEAVSDMIPKIGLPHRRRRSRGQVPADPSTSSHAMKSRTRSSSVASGSSNEDSDEAPSKSTPLPVDLPNLKRKRAPSDSELESIASPAKSPTEPEASLVSKYENSAFLGNFLASFSDWTLTGYFSAPQIQQLPVLLRPDDQTQVAQLLVDQVTRSSLNHGSGVRVGHFGFECDVQPSRTLFDDIDFPGTLSKLDLKDYASLLDETAVPSTQETTKDPARGSIAKVSTPHIRVRRGKDFLETLPPAVSFWETFGLEPAYGAKDVLAYCIHAKVAAKAADAFMDRFALTYQSCNFGVHRREDKDKAMRTWDVESPTYSTMIHSLKELCEELASDLSKSPPTTDHLVVYIINPFNHAAALADICAAFCHLSRQLIADDPQNWPTNSLVLQIIPMDFIFSGEYMVVPKQADYLKLAFEVYGRCRPKDAESMPVVCAPAVLLADPVPKSINFRLAAEKLSPLQDGRSLHIACSKSSDQRWISVAWSDGTGSIQTTMSYCLRYRNKSATRSITEVRNEIWATTKDIMDRFQARWRVILANTEPMDADDVEGWINLADLQNNMRPASLELSIVIVNSIPELVLEPPILPMTTAVLNPHFSSTPVSTPNPSVSIASPEPNAPTPGAIYSAPTPSEPALEPDADIVLADISDESWTVVLSHRLNSSAHIADYRPALASGYLLRRKGSSDSNGVHSMTVNLVYSPRPSSHHDSALRDILAMYRDLATLARARGMRSVQKNTLPWHIAAALRGQELLSYVF